MNTMAIVLAILVLLVIGLTGVSLYLHEQNEQLRGGLKRLKRELEEKNESTKRNNPDFDPWRV